jgi:hypothetical protein
MEDETHDSRVRKFALEQAVLSINGAPYTEIVRAAESFYGFLTGGSAEEILSFDSVEEALDIDLSDKIAGQVISKSTPPPIPTQDHGQADQSPPRFSVPESAYHNSHVVIGGNPNVYAIERDADNIPTRLVRREPTDDGFPVV